MNELDVRDPEVRDERREAARLEPDVIVPSQYFDRIRRRCDFDPERQLMIAVLELAVNDYLKAAAGARDVQVEEWVESRDASWLYSFESICTVLDIDADYLRRGLQSWGRRGAGTRAEAARPTAPTIDADEEGLRRASA